jgi:CDGSH-type Zn-finger protein
MSNSGKVNASGSLSISGQVTVCGADGARLFEGDKTWLCRCGNSRNKPFCDGSHKNAGFSDAGVAAPCAAIDLGAGPLRVTALADGPLQVEGPLTLTGADGAAVYCGDRTWLCRCGHSANKPFCDGSHKRIGFTG